MDLPEKDIFTNRKRQLGILEKCLADTEHGRPIRLSFMGLRRIGKSILFNHFIEEKRRQGKRNVALIDFEEACTSPELFCQRYLGAIANQVLGAEDETHVDFLRLDTALSTEASKSPAFTRTAGMLLEELGKKKPDQSFLLETSIDFPEQLARETGIPLLLFLDEFQYLFDLRRFGDLKPARVFRARVQKQKGVGYVIAGSAVSVMEDVLGSSESPLFGMFKQERLGPFDRDSALELSSKIIRDANARMSGAIYKYTKGFPYYVAVVSESVEGLWADSMDDLDKVKLAFLTEAVAEWGRIYNHCRYIRDVSLERARGAGNLKAILQVIAEAPEGITISEAARQIHKDQQPTRNYLLELCRIDILRREGDQFFFKDQVFKFWVASETESVLWSATPTVYDILNSLDKYEENLARLSWELGTAKEFQLRELLRSAGGQVLDGDLFGADEYVNMPEFETVERQVAEDGGDIDAVAYNDEVWACEIKWQNKAAGEKEIERFVERAKQIRADVTWFISRSGFTGEALEVAKELDVLTSDGYDFSEIEELVLKGKSK